MQTNELREKYLEFFESKGCVRRPSDLLIPPEEDKSVLFTPAGMNQFKSQFLGIGKLEFTKATTCQKCLRTGDIGNVGVTAYHHTFFEMLGNFSFGDYFKREAIHWAWEFLTDKKWLGLDDERLTVTVYKDDDEAFGIWENDIKLPAKRITRDDEYENFWPAGAPSDGPDGVCGPCSEIYYHPPGGGPEVEIWNLVFTQFNRVGNPPDNLRPLPKKNIDTGMGLERTAAVLQGHVSNYEIDILRPICEAAGELVGKKYDFDAPQGRGLRRITDHTRAATFALHEGVGPSPNGAGYIIRLLLRRAFLEGYLLGQHDPFLHQLVPAIVEQMVPAYPDLQKTIGSVTDAIKQEEERFLGTLERGLTKFNRLVKKTKASGSTVLPGREVFDLHQTDGFVKDLTVALADDHDMTIDEEGFKKAAGEHINVSGQGGVGGTVMAAGPLDDIENKHGETEFIGYETTEATTKVIGILVDQQPVESLDSGDGDAALLLDKTPFYRRSGGQVGDVGEITIGPVTFEVTDTLKHGGLHVHVGRMTNGKLSVGDEVTASVDATRRAGIQRAHSATHLLHHALQTVLGEDATQRGSEVSDDMLRFDFAHGSPVTTDQLTEIEDIINRRVVEAAPVDTKFMPQDEAKQLGAMALFGEKYPDIVRVVSIGDFSTELCGGTHLDNTGQVGLCRIVREESASAGVRRMTAITGDRAIAQIRDTEKLLTELQQQLKTPSPTELPNRVASLLDELKQAKQQLAEQTRKSLASVGSNLYDDADEIDGVKVIGGVIPNGTREGMREMIDKFRAKGQPVAIVLGTEIDGKVALIAAVSKEIVGRVKASDAVRTAAQACGGGGGGRPDMAEAGGSKPDQLPQAIEAGLAFYREQLGG